MIIIIRLFHQEAAQHISGVAIKMFVWGGGCPRHTGWSTELDLSERF